MIRRLRFPILLAAALLTAPAAGSPPISPDAAAVVNGVAVPRKALLDVVQSLIAQLDDIPDPQTTEKYRRQALDSLIDFELLYQEGQAHNLAIMTADINNEIKRTESSFPSPKAYEEALKSNGLTRQDIERETRRALMVKRVLTEIVWPGVAAHEEDIARYYEQHRTEFEHAAQIRASYILIRAKKDAPERAKARARAASLVQRARAGEDFAALARASSEDPATAQNGGDLGYIAPGTMGEAFDQAAFALQPGQVSEAVETPFGFMVIEVTSKREAGISPLPEVHDRIATGLKEEGREKAQEKFVADLRARAKIEISPDLR